jgi:hypothetical protein
MKKEMCLEQSNLSEDTTDSFKEALKELIIEQRDILSRLSSNLISAGLREDLELDHRLILSKISDLKTKITFEDFLNVNKELYCRK